MPVLLQGLHDFLVVEAWPEVVPAQADTTENDGAALLVAQLGAFHLQLSVLLDGLLGYCVQYAKAKDCS